MPAKIRIFTNETGLRMRVSIRKGTDSTIYNGSTFEDYTTTNYANYYVSVPEQGASRFYSVDVPAISAGSYDLTFYHQATTTAASEANDIPYGSASFSWTGTTEITRYTIDTAISAIQTIVNNMTFTSGLIHAQLNTNTASLVVDLNADQSAVTVGIVNNLGASATAQVNSEADAALADASVTSNVMNTIITNLDAALSSRSTFDAATTPVNVGQISGSTNAADLLETSILGMISAATIAGTATTTQVSTNLTEATNDHFNGRIIVFTSGELNYQATDITDYDGTNKIVTFTALTEVPSVGSSFIIV